MPEQRVSFGELYPDRTFYVIRLYPPATGYLANYIYVLGYMNYAYSKGWIPVIDMKNYQNLYNGEPKESGYEDVWGWFFEQPWDDKHQRRYTLEEVYNSKNVVLSCGSEDFHDASYDPGIVDWQRHMCKMIPFKESFAAYITEQSEIALTGDKKVIGIPVRGTDLGKHVAGHSIQMTKEEAVQLYKELSAEWYNGDCVAYINAEEQEIIDYVNSHIENVRFSDTKRAKDYTGGSAAYANKEQTAELVLRDYITNMYIMSKCDSLIGTHNNGFYVAYLWSDGEFEHFKKIDKGVYL